MRMEDTGGGGGTERKTSHHLTGQRACTRSQLRKTSRKMKVRVVLSWPELTQIGCGTGNRLLMNRAVLSLRVGKQIPVRELDLSGDLSV